MNFYTITKSRNEIVLRSRRDLRSISSIHVVDEFFLFETIISTCIKQPGSIRWNIPRNRSSFQVHSRRHTGEEKARKRRIFFSLSRFVSFAEVKQRARATEAYLNRWSFFVRKKRDKKRAIPSDEKRRAFSKLQPGNNAGLCDSYGTINPVRNLRLGDDKPRPWYVYTVVKEANVAYV